jgi:hypothetical protein
MVSYTPGGLPGRLPYTGTRSPGTRLMHITRPEPSRPHAPAALGVESLRASGGPPSNLPYTSQATYPIPPCRSTLHRPRPSTLYLPSRIPYTSHPTYPTPPIRPTLCRPRPHTLHHPPSSNPPSRPAYPIHTSHLPHTRSPKPPTLHPTAGDRPPCLRPPGDLPYTATDRIHYTRHLPIPPVLPVDLPYTAPRETLRMSLSPNRPTLYPPPGSQQRPTANNHHRLLPVRPARRRTPASSRWEI